MSEYYKLKSFKPSDFQDNFGNTWCDASFEGIGEPVKWVVKDPARIKVGEEYYGHVEDKTSKANKPYQRFYADKDEQATQPPKQDDKYWEERNSSIRAQFAIKAAVELLKNPEADIAEDTILHWARIFYSMVEQVPQQTPKVDEVFEPDEDQDINLDAIPY